MKALDNKFIDFVDNNSTAMNTNLKNWVEK